MAKIFRNTTTGNIVKAKNDIAAALMERSKNYEEVKQGKKATANSKKDESKED